MLVRLSIKNIALIDSADIQFDSRLNVLSGETGSGKSVILDSINFVLGSKADKSMIRHGQPQAQVTAEFQVDGSSPAAKAVEELDIECDGQIIISRKFSLDGKGSIKLNGNSVTAAMLKSVTSHLVDVHGQSEHFFLLSESNQLKVLDSLCGSAADDVKKKLAQAVADKRKILKKIAELGGDEQERERQIDLLSYQINEIRAAEVREGEYDELKTKRELINNTERILSSLGGAAEYLNSDGGCLDLISSAQRQLAGISDISAEYSKMYERIENLYSEADDIARSLNDMLEEVSFDEGEAEYVEERLELLRSLMKKYGPDERSVIEYLESASLRHEALLNSAEELKRLNCGLEKIDDEIYAICMELSDLRKTCAGQMSMRVVEQMKSLNIPDAKFCVEFNSYDRQTAELDSANGSDAVRFMFSANKGEPLKPLGKIISGGEMSRFMLAIKTQLKGINGISTYIFDEIDAGISGVTAGTVAQKFVDIGRDTQIIAVSHLPQVCAASDAQFLIYKTEEDGKTVTRVSRLNDEQKIGEIVRLTGNIDSNAAREHAKQLIEQFIK